MRGRISILALLFSALSAVVPAALNAQASGSLVGTVNDPAGAVVAGAEVVVRSSATGEARSVTTNEEGRFRIDNLAPGSYRVSVRGRGFKTAERSLAVEAGRASTLEIKLEIEAPREEVKVGTKGTFAPNADTVSRALRDGGALET